MQASIYFDNNSTTPLDQDALKEMLPFFTQVFGNPSSIHSLGKEAARGVEQSKIQVAELLGANASEIIFTSGATEAITLAMKAVFYRYQSIGNHIITCRTERMAVLDVCRYSQNQDAESTFLAVDENRDINLEDLR